MMLIYINANEISSFMLYTRLAIVFKCFLYVMMPSVQMMSIQQPSFITYKSTIQGV